MPSDAAQQNGWKKLSRKGIARLPCFQPDDGAVSQRRLRYAGDIMEDLKEKQIEALQTAVPYCEKMITALNSLIEEYSKEKKEDTDEYMKEVSEGLNWIFEVYNGTSSLINADKAVIDQEAANESVLLLNKANEENDDAMRANAFRGILKFVEKFKAEAEKYALS